MELREKLMHIQSELKCPKDQFNIARRRGFPYQPPWLLSWNITGRDHLDSHNHDTTGIWHSVGHKASKIHAQRV